MNYSVLLSFLLLFGTVGCQNKNEDNLSITYTSVVQFIQPNICCSNMEIINLEPVYSELVGYSETLLAAINIDDFANQDIENGDTLEIVYIFSADLLPCNSICNRLNGIPIQVISLTKS